MKNRLIDFAICCLCGALIGAAMARRWRGPSDMTRPDTESLMARLGDAVEAQLPAGAFAVVCAATPVKGGYEAMTVAVRCRDRVAMASFIEHAAAMLMAADPETKIHTDEDRP